MDPYAQITDIGWKEGVEGCIEANRNFLLPLVEYILLKDKSAISKHLRSFISGITTYKAPWFHHFNDSPPGYILRYLFLPENGAVKTGARECIVCFTYGLA